MDMDMDHGSHTMGNMTASATASAIASATASATSTMDHAMSKGGNACKISMLWNWNTIDACFLSRTWHVTTKAMFAGSVLGVFGLCLAIELVRRVMREYDRRLTAAAGEKGLVQPTWGQHALRSAMYGVQFTGAFLVMLLGMYYNGFILFAIFLGHTVGYFLFARDTCSEQQTESGCAC